MIYNYLIVEDNPGAMKNLQLALREHENFQEIGTAETLTQGITKAKALGPHLIFLDVELGNENGFDLIKEIRQHTTKRPFIIMTTAVDKYAKTAVNQDVLYFLDKPIDPDELLLALQKFERAFLDGQNHLIIKDTKGHHFVLLEEIEYIQSDNSVCKIFRTGQKLMCVSKTLKELESTLPKPFIRVHKSYVVNPKYVQMINTSKKKLELLSSSSNEAVEIPIGESYLEAVRMEFLTPR